METALRKSHQTIVNFGFQRSAKVPPINEKKKMGANSATDINETAYAYHLKKDVGYPTSLFN
jgi:hypothetical protein